LFVRLEDSINELLIPRPARGEALAHEVRLFTDQFDVEHDAI
jgi:hypothetical protein